MHIQWKPSFAQHKQLVNTVHPGYPSTVVLQHYTVCVWNSYIHGVDDAHVRPDTTRREVDVILCTYCASVHGTSSWCSLNTLVIRHAIVFDATDADRCSRSCLSSPGLSILWYKSWKVITYISKKDDTGSDFEFPCEDDDVLSVCNVTSIPK